LLSILKCCREDDSAVYGPTTNRPSLNWHLFFDISSELD
jgi:hypothetical protein